jgi:hypothetical protein
LDKGTEMERAGVPRSQCSVKEVYEAVDDEPLEQTAKMRRLKYPNTTSFNCANSWEGEGNSMVQVLFSSSHVGIWGSKQKTS